MNALVSRRALLGATAAVGALSLPAVVEAGIPASGPGHPDAELFRLLDAWGPARARADAAEAAAQALWDAYVEQEPERPEALRVRFGDDFGVRSCTKRGADGRWVDLYDRTAAEELRRKAPPVQDEWEGQPAPWSPDEQVGQ